MANEITQKTLEELKIDEIKQENLKIAREASWLSALFQKFNLDSEDKQEIFRRLAKVLNGQP